MRTTTQLLAVLLGYALPSSALADIIHVPAEYLTIQGAIDSATDGDEIIVAPGTYNETIDFSGKAITLHSSNGREVTTIDGTGLNDSVVRCMSGEGPDTVLEGFTITGGTGRHSPVPPTVLGGGGMFNLGSSPTVTDCIFVGNTAIDGETSARGGGMYNLNGSSPTVTDCVFRENTATATGGMYNLEGSDVVVIGCDFIENIASGQAGMTNAFNNPTIIGCRFIGNVATHTMTGGGGMVLLYTTGGTISNCIFVNNTAGGAGGIWIIESSLIVVNCIIAHNTATSTGGGIFVALEGTTEIINCTIFGNSASLGAGIAMHEAGNTLLTNSIVWDNGADQIWGDLQVAFSDVQGGYEGSGNIDIDPMFIDVDGPDNDPDTWEDNDYRLQALSPCIDAADSSAVPPDIETDLNGDPRFVDDLDTEDTGAGSCPFVDMGAFEYQEGIAGCCRPDFDGDGIVGPFDLAALLGAWGPCDGCPQDLNGDGVVGPIDLATLLGAWGPCL